MYQPLAATVLKAALQVHVYENLWPLELAGTLASSARKIWVLAGPSAGLTSIGVHNLSPGLVLTGLLLDGASPAARRFFNTLAEEPETVAAALVPRMRAVQVQNFQMGDRVSFCRNLGMYWLLDFILHVAFGFTLKLMLWLLGPDGRMPEHASLLDIVTFMSCRKCFA